MACRQTEASNAGSNDVGQEDPERINVMFLCDEWKSSKGGLSTFNREFAVNLAKSASDRIKVHCYVSQSDKLGTEDARQHGVNLITAQIIPGSTDPLDWLKTPPPELPNPDIVIGHGRKLGIPAFFIARLRDAKSKWVHFVHVFCEDLGKYKVTQSASLDSIEENEKKHKKEIELCKAADVVVAVGSRLQQKYSRSLPSIKVEVITPGIIEKFYTESSQLVKDRSVVKKFNVFMFGRSTFEDRTLKGYDIIANAIGSLGKMFELTFVGSSPGEHRKIEQWFLDNTDISRNQLTIRSYCNEQDELKMMFHESDVVVLPSRTEGFGLVALEAISAGIPVLVAGESGIAEALEQVEGGNSVTVESDGARDWAQRIQQLSNQSPEDRDNNAKLLRENYSKTYSWNNECERFQKMIQDLVESLTCNDDLQAQTDYGKLKTETDEDDSVPLDEGVHSREQHQERQIRRQRGPRLGYRKLQELQSTKPSEMAVSLLQYRESFEMLVNAEKIKEDWMTLLVEILGKMCHTQMAQNLIDVMSICKGSAFMRTHLPKYILNLPMIQEEMESESQFSVLVECLMTFFKEWLVRFPRSFSTDIPIDHFGRILKNISVKGVEEFRKEVEILLSERRELIGEKRKMAQTPKETKRQEVEPPPPDDFKEISIYPNKKEIHSEEKPFLRRNKTEKTEKYKDLNDYLDVQFRLLREDFVAPLREGIKEIIKKTPKNDRSQNLYIYENVEIMNTVCTTAGIVHCIHLDMRSLRKIPWEHSKRLLFGSFLCLSRDNFKIMLFATVANRKPEDLRSGRLGIRFVEDLEATQRTRDKYVMVESPAYFEAYRPILQQLKQVTSETFPFQEYLVHCNSDVKLPQYLRDKKSRKQVQYDLGETLGVPDVEGANKVSVCDFHTWPHFDGVKLNESQLESLKGALTKEFSVIQGPPGTGKTYVGLKIVRALLDNRHVWDAEKKSAMLMVCYTNHALDQFLEGVLKFQQTGIIRVGGRCSSESLQRYNLHEYTTSSDNRRRIKVEMAKCKDAIERATRRLAISKRNILTLRELQNLVDWRHLEQLKAEENTFKLQGQSVIQGWLGLKHSNSSPAGSSPKKMPAESVRVENELTSDDANEGTEESIEVDKDADIIENRRLLGENIVNRGENQFQLLEGQDNATQGKTTISGLSNDHLKVLRGESKLHPLHPAQVANVQHVWSLSFEDRWRLYLVWLRIFQLNCQEEISRKSEEYESICKRFTEVRDYEELQALREAVVIGMITTGAAKYRAILEEIKPTIVVVEEAAEVLEAHIITSLTKWTQHLILIGDHKQLRPNPTVYTLAREHNLDVSLFERMVNSGMRCYQLNTQHRMRPEIARLMRFIYEDLQDHESVHEYEDVSGVSKNIYFIDHRFLEDESEINNKLKSHSNKHEAEYIAALCEYFILQGYAPQQITVLTMYTGQVITLKKTMPKAKFAGVRVTAVDNFQGEENDIILLSLVRSNRQRKIGFLAVKNRVCVALSRARKGLYCIGNFALLADKSELWKLIVDDMKQQNAIGESLKLVCSNHPERIIYAKVADDFKKAPEGGCILPCAFRLPCGHVCERVCHTDDSDHALYKCQKDCPMELCSEHESRCNRKCHFGQDCPGCPVEIEKEIPACGHKQIVPCGMPVETFKCQMKCLEFLPCGHLCPGKCWEDCSSFQCLKIIKREFDCGHEIEKPCWELSQSYRCEEPCRAILECEHPCVGNCSECKQGRMHVPCKAACERIRVCLHLCQAPCTKNCPPCPEKCENRCIHSRCPKQCMEPCTPCRERCSWICPHFKCTRLCGEKCNRPRCNEPCKKRLLIGSSLCSFNHPCIGLCGEPCPKLCRICQKDKVTEVFFGTEEEKDARFIELLDCGHVFEVTALDYWMDKDGENDNVKLKECPKCKTPIRISYRYADIVKEKLTDVELVKKRLIEEERQYQELTKRLKGKTHSLARKYPDVRLRKALSETDSESDYENEQYEEHKHTDLGTASYEILWSWLQQRKTMTELNTIKNQIKLLKKIYKVRENIKTDLLRNTCHGVLTPSSTSQSALDQMYLKAATEVHEKLNHLEQDLMKFQISLQRLTDIRDEVVCVGLLLKIRVVQCEIKKRSIPITFDNEEWLARQGNQLDAGSELSKQDADDIETTIDQIRRKCGFEGVTPEQRVMIVKAMNFSQGHWYKCPNGHIYAIGECGRPVEQRSCPECGEIIGGKRYHLAQGNMFATEMDVANYGAWSNQTNLHNYDPNKLRRLQFE